MRGRHSWRVRRRRVRVQLHQGQVRRPLWPPLVCAAVTAALIVGAAAVALTSTPPQPAAPDRVSVQQDQPPDQITYTVTSEGVRSASITYVGDTVSRELSEVPLPWTVTMPLKRGALQNMAMLAIGDGGTSRATLTCAITRNGTPVAQTTDTGPNARPACSHTGP